MMVQAAIFVNGEFDHFFRAWCKANLSKDDAVSTTNNSFYSVANLVQFHTEITQDYGGDPFSLTYKPQQEVFSANVIMLKALRFFLRETQNLPGQLRDLMKRIPLVHCLSSFFHYTPVKLNVA